MSFSSVLESDPFDEAFIPERLIGREGQVKEIARCLLPIKSGKPSRNLFIHGPPGVGKTSVCRSILETHFPKNSVYINCWSKRSFHKIMEEMLLQLGIIVHGKESTSELVKRFEKSGKKPIVCLDEADHLKDKDILYTLARNACVVILISNFPFTPTTLDARIRSSLFLNEIEFKPYTRDEILSILKERIAFGLRDGLINEHHLSMISGMCSGDARIALQTLRHAVMEAESRQHETVTVDDILYASRCARKYKLSYLLGKLNEHQKAVYEILKRNRTMDSGRLFEEYCKSVTEPVVDRAYRNHMERMEELGLVRSEGNGRWKRYLLVQ